MSRNTPFIGQMERDADFHDLANFVTDHGRETVARKRERESRNGWPSKSSLQCPTTQGRDPILLPARAGSWNVVQQGRGMWDRGRADHASGLTVAIV